MMKFGVSFFVAILAVGSSWRLTIRGNEKRVLQQPNTKHQKRQTHSPPFFKTAQHKDLEQEVYDHHLYQQDMYVEEITNTTFPAAAETTSPSAGHHCLLAIHRKNSFTNPYQLLLPTIIWLPESTVEPLFFQPDSFYLFFCILVAVLALLKALTPLPACGVLPKFHFLSTTF